MTRAEAVRELLARRGDIELEFVRRAHNRVHVVVPGDPDADDTARPPETAEEKFQLMLALARRAVPTMCGRTELVYFAEPERAAIMVDTFPDHDLCVDCWKALGAQAFRAFEHPQPAPTPERLPMTNPDNNSSEISAQDLRTIQQNAQRLSNEGDHQGAAGLSALLDLVTGDE